MTISGWLAPNYSGDSLRTRSFRLVPVVLDVKLGCLGGVVSRMVMMALSCVCVMGGRFMVARFVVFGGFAMMSRRVLVMFCCFAMMLCCLL
ncbi:MAG: hypothetical protein ACRD50_01170 [Candidatus Acidiferrales bacterium]